MKRRAAQTIRNSVISIIVIILACLAAGTAYTLWAGQASPRQTAPAPKPVSIPREVTPPKPAANAKVGVSINALMSPIAAGTNAEMSVQTTAGAVCSASVVYNGVASKDSGLAPKKADAYGVANWTWTIPKATPAGNWPVKVTCSRGSQSAVVDATQQVTP